jgi:low affinity iron permease
MKKHSPCVSHDRGVGDNRPSFSVFRHLAAGYQHGHNNVTFLMVFLIQNTQNRDMLTVQLKLSELVLAMEGAKNKFAAVEDLSDEELEELHNECRARAEMTLDHLHNRHRRRRPEHSKAHATAHRPKSYRGQRTTAKNPKFHSPGTIVP